MLYARHRATARNTRLPDWPAALLHRGHGGRWRLTKVSSIGNPPPSKKVKTQAVKEKKPINWLREIDRQAESLPKQPDNAYYGLFRLVRYPWLLAEPLNQLVRIEMAHIRKAISTDKETKRVLEGLSPVLRTQLAALIIDTRADLDDFFGKGELKNLAKKAQMQTKKLRQALTQAKSAVRLLHTYASKAHPHIGENARVLAEEGFSFLEQIRIPTKKYVNELPEYSHILQPTKRVGLNTAKLFGFFHYGCELTKAEAEIRTALIRNKFWVEWVDTIPVRLEYDGIESKGCESVRRAVERFRN
jgi:hypothetical protein